MKQICIYVTIVLYIRFEQTRKIYGANEEMNINAIRGHKAHLETRNICFNRRNFACPKVVKSLSTFRWQSASKIQDVASHRVPGHENVAVEVSKPENNRETRILVRNHYESRSISCIIIYIPIGIYTEVVRELHRQHSFVYSYCSCSPHATLPRPTVLGDVKHSTSNRAAFIVNVAIDVSTPLEIIPFIVQTMKYFTSK